MRLADCRKDNLNTRSDPSPMRGADTFTESLFTMRKLEDFVPARHPLREIRKTANTALEKLGPMLTAMYAAELKGGRTSVAPEKLLRAMLLQVLFGVRSERQLMEQVHYNLMFRWFIGLSRPGLGTRALCPRTTARTVTAEPSSRCWAPRWPIAVRIF